MTVQLYACYKEVLLATVLIPVMISLSLSPRSIDRSIDLGMLTNTNTCIVVFCYHMRYCFISSDVHLCYENAIIFNLDAKLIKVWNDGCANIWKTPFWKIKTLFNTLYNK